ncbi:MAG: hypothetical protein ACXWUH_05010, partial [Burkholderiales bacterium]
MAAWHWGSPAMTLLHGGIAITRAAVAQLHASRLGNAAWQAGFVTVHAVPQGAAATRACAFEVQV